MARAQWVQQCSINLSHGTDNDILVFCGSSEEEAKTGLTLGWVRKGVLMNKSEVSGAVLG